MSRPGSTLSRRPSRGFVMVALARLLLLGLFAGSMYLLWWSINRLPPASNRVAGMNRQISSLTEEIERMERVWSPIVIEDVADRFLEARAELMDPEKLVAWEEQLRRRAEALSLQTKADVGEALSEKVGEATIRPALIEVEPIGATSQVFPYQRVLELNQHLTGEGRRVEIVELKVEGQSNSVSRAWEMVWVWTSGGEAK